MTLPMCYWWQCMNGFQLNSGFNIAEMRIRRQMAYSFSNDWHSSKVERSSQSWRHLSKSLSNTAQGGETEDVVLITLLWHITIIYIWRLFNEITVTIRYKGFCSCDLDLAFVPDQYISKLDSLFFADRSWCNYQVICLLGSISPGEMVSSRLSPEVLT